MAPPLGVGDPTWVVPISSVGAALDPIATAIEAHGYMLKEHAINWLSFIATSRQPILCSVRNTGQGTLARLRDLRYGCKPHAIMDKSLTRARVDAAVAAIQQLDPLRVLSYTKVNLYWEVQHIPWEGVAKPAVAAREVQLSQLLLALNTLKGNIELYEGQVGAWATVELPDEAQRSKSSQPIVVPLGVWVYADGGKQVVRRALAPIKLHWEEGLKIRDIAPDDLRITGDYDMHDLAAFDSTHRQFVRVPISGTPSWLFALNNTTAPDRLTPKYVAACQPGAGPTPFPFSEHKDTNAPRAVFHHGAQSSFFDHVKNHNAQEQAAHLERWVDALVRPADDIIAAYRVDDELHVRRLPTQELILSWYEELRGKGLVASTDPWFSNQHRVILRVARDAAARFTQAGADAARARAAVDKLRTNTVRGERPAGPAPAPTPHLPAVKPGGHASTLVLDPGHGGATPNGKSQPQGLALAHGAHEKDLTFLICHTLARALPGAARLTRGAEDNPSLAQRARAAHGAPAFLSVHVHDDLPHGASRVWVHPAAGPPALELAQRVAEALGGAPIEAAPLAVLHPGFQGVHRAAALLELGVDPRLGLPSQDILDGLAQRLRAALAPYAAQGQGEDDPAEVWGRR